MHRALSSLVVLSSAAAAVLAGCLGNGGDSSMLVLENEAALAGGTCTFTATGMEANISHGEITADSPVGYLIHPLIQSRLASNSTGGSGGSNQRIILIQGARLDISFGSSTLFSAAELADLQTSGLTHNKALFSIPLEPGGFSVGEFEAVSQPLLDKIGTKLRASTSTAVELDVSAVVYGTVDGDTSASVSSPSFHFPVTVCIDCITNVTGSCTGVAATAGSNTNPCNPYQDGSVSCCTAKDGSTVCPGA